MKESKPTPRRNLVPMLFLYLFAVAPVEAEQPKPNSLPRDLTPVEFGEIRKQLEQSDQPWSRIFWHSSLTEARLRAAEEGKPLLIRASWGTLHGVC